MAINTRLGLCGSSCTCSVFPSGESNFYNRKLKQGNTAMAHNALAHKLARAAYYIIRDNVPFEEAKIFA